MSRLANDNQLSQTGQVVGQVPLNGTVSIVHLSPQPMGVQLVSIQTSSNDRLLWALDNRGSVFVRTGLSHEMPVGTAWEMVPGTSTVCCSDCPHACLSV